MPHFSWYWVTGTHGSLRCYTHSGIFTFRPTAILVGSHGLSLKSDKAHFLLTVNLGTLGGVACVMFLFFFLFGGTFLTWLNNADVSNARHWTGTSNYILLIKENLNFKTKLYSIAKSQDFSVKLLILEILKTLACKAPDCMRISTFICLKGLLGLKL